MDKFKNNQPKDEKQQQLDDYRVQNRNKPLTTNLGIKITNDENILTAGERGPSLHQDWHYFEKMTHFVQEEQPERVVHARGYSAHGEFECYQSMKDVTMACFLQEPGKKTPVTVRFSTVQGAKGSYDTARDLRCKGVKFYTEEGNYDLTTIAMPVLINNDPMKFPDAMHAYQSKDDDDIPTATGAHDFFWDYVANNPEAIHMVTWIMSDRGIIKNYRHMESWSINTYLFVNDKGIATFVRFVWKPLLGVQSLLQEEAIQLGGIDPDYHRKDLREAIDRGAYPEYELGVQLIPMEDEFKFDFDILDPTKFWPEEIIPVQIIGKLTLNRNIDNYHAESEQVAFNPANVIPGIDFSNDPVLQGRLIAYHNAQTHRMGPNFQELPINKPICPVHNNQRRGPMRFRIDVDEASYHKNSLANNTPFETQGENGGYIDYPKKVDGSVIRSRSDSFKDFYSQTRIFWNSLTPIEQKHTIEAFAYQLGKVKSESIRQQNVNLLANIDERLASTVADYIGVERPKGTQVEVTTRYPSLSQFNTKPSAYTQKIGVLICNGFDGKEVTSVLKTLEENGCFIDIVSDKLGTITGTDGTTLKVNRTFITSSPLLFDSLYVVGGQSLNQAVFDENVAEFLYIAYKYFKPIGIALTAEMYLNKSEKPNPEGVVFASDSTNFGQEFVHAIAQQRFWNRK